MYTHYLWLTPVLIRQSMMCTRYLHSDFLIFCLYYICLGLVYSCPQYHGLFKDDSLGIFSPNVHDLSVTRGTPSDLSLSISAAISKKLKRMLHFDFVHFTDKNVFIDFSQIFRKCEQQCIRFRQYLKKKHCLVNICGIS